MHDFNLRHPIKESEALILENNPKQFIIEEQKDISELSGSKEESYSQQEIIPEIVSFPRYSKAESKCCCWKKYEERRRSIKPPRILTVEMQRKWLIIIRKIVLASRFISALVEVKQEVLGIEGIIDIYIYIYNVGGNNKEICGVANFINEYGPVGVGHQMHKGTTYSCVYIYIYIY